MNNTDTINASDDVRARERGLEIATRFQITRDGDSDLWLVPAPPSRSFRCGVVLRENEAESHCTCSEFAETGEPCCHIYAARFAQMRERGQPVPVPEYLGDVPAGSPAWVTADLIRTTLQVMSVNYRERLTPTDAVVMLITVGQLAELD
jgi:hypothetical protein